MIKILEDGSVEFRINSSPTRYAQGKDPKLKTLESIYTREEFEAIFREVMETGKVLFAKPAPKSQPAPKTATKPAETTGFKKPKVTIKRNRKKQ